MQTKHQIQELLSSAGVLPNKRFGQHFLIDLNLMRLLIDSADIHENDIVLEVGCGTGSLTEGLAERAGKVIAVEVDRTIAKIAEEQLADKTNVRVINSDILQKKNTISRAVTTAVRLARQTLGGLARQKYAGRFLLVANLPYNVASPVMLNLVTGPTVADAMYVTVQKQVAERMTATAGRKDFGILSILLHATGDVKTIRVLKPTVFWPQPQVDSAMISFVRNNTKVSRILNMELLSATVNLFMSHRRKMIKACTRFAAGKFAGIEDWDQVFAQCSIDPHKRPEQLPPEDYIALANLCHRRLSGS